LQAKKGAGLELAVAVVSASVLADLPASSPTGALPAAAEGDDELDMAATASSLLPASFDTVIVVVAGF
jgi:hypothetical protein